MKNPKGYNQETVKSMKLPLKRVYLQSCYRFSFILYEELPSEAIARRCFSK